MSSYVVSIVVLFLIHASGEQHRTSTPLFKYIDLMYQDDETFRTICLETTGSEEIAGQMVQENQRLKVCVDRHHDPKRFTVDLDQISEENHAIVIKYHCTTFDEIRKCYDPFLFLMKTCLNGPDYEITEHLVVLNKEFDYICHDNGVHVVPGSTNYTACGAALNNMLTECSGSDWSGISTKTINTLTEPNCRTLEQINTCFHKKVESCGAPLFAKLLELRFLWIIEKTSCSKITFST